MALDRNAFIDNFLEELSENIESIDARILTLKRDPDNQEELASLLRSLHTIKGSSRMLKFSTVEQIAHGLENVFKGVKDGRFEINRNLVQLVFLTTDYLRSCNEKIRTEKNDDIPVQKLMGVFEKAYANEPYSLEGLKLAPSSGFEVDGFAPESPANFPRKEGLLRTAQSIKGAVQTESTPSSPNKAQSVTILQAAGNPETIRVKVDKVDGIIKLLNNLIIKQFQLKKENDVLEEIERHYKELSFLRISHHGAAKATPPEIQKKENDFLKLIRDARKRFAEELILLERNTFEVQGEILGLRMLPLDLILSGLGKMVEETSLALGKDIRLEVSGSELTLDRLILENLRDPLIHLIRNSIDHGIERPEERQNKGKSRAGSIMVRCAAESGTIVIRVGDDGKGIDYENIRRKAIEANPMQEDEIRAMDEGALNAFLFMTGFSTRAEITELSGRGVGLDIVRYNMEKIKGKISLTSRKESGTEFTLTLPLSLAKVDGFFVRAAGEKFLLPSNYVKEMIVIKEDDKLDLLNRKAIKIRDKIVPVRHLSDILEKAAEAKSGKKLYVAVVESLGEMIGIVVDQVVQYASLIYKPLPRNLAGLKLLQGVVFDENFNIINILYVPEIMKRFRSRRAIESKNKFSLERPEYKHILVVDDSYATREIEKSILELENYNIETAVDGIDALEKLKGRHFHLIVTDIYMPRMDGYTLVENVRRDERLKKIPIIVVSSEKDREKQRRLVDIGISRFLDKADFDRGNLIQEVRQLIG